MMKMMLLKVIEQYQMMISSLIEKWCFFAKAKSFDLLKLNEEDLDLLLPKIFLFDYSRSIFLDLIPVLQLMHELISLVFLTRK
jgi:hypothetical protein